MLQHVPRSLLTCRNRPNTSMQRHPLLRTIIHPPMQNIVVVKRYLSSFQLHRDLARHIRFIRRSSPLVIRPRPLMTPRNKHQTTVIVQRKIPLRMVPGLLQPRQLFLRRRTRRDIVPMPPQLEIPLGPHKHVVQLHRQIPFLARDQRSHVLEQLGVKIRPGEEYVVGIRRV
ncbi:hypothetical protein B5807_07045 [Epicoccum nigrum]|uniref:Uncharacterized protein n=1 Tax=Epicoccum nigrum TaxID=105696 RepID=A0A1Y2LXQ3_EPING|nr:hypothetical protein B5807_07045 [Epicoccum nigrum]